MANDFYTYVHSIGNNIFYRGIKNNKKIITTVKSSDYQPILHLKKSAHEQTDAICINGDKLKEKEFDSIKSAKEYISLCKDSYTKIYGMTNFTYSFISDLYHDQEKIKYDNSLIRIFFIDIENLISDEGFLPPEQAAMPITAITVYDSFTQLYTCFSLRPNNNSDSRYIPDSTRTDIVFHEYEFEQELLEQFLLFWKTNYPDIVTGWNTNMYDIPYIYFRIKKILSEDKAQQLSPFNFINTKMAQNLTNISSSHMAVIIYGISSMDYLEMYKKFTYSSQESYRLNYIAHTELGENKVDYSAEGNLNDLYHNNFNKFIHYNIHDVELVVSLNNKLKFFNIVYDLAYLTKVNFSDTLGVVKIWDVFIYNYLRQQGYIIPPEKLNEGGQFAGAYVKDPLVGLHEWIVTFDAGSLYPSLIRQFNMSPETIMSPITNPIAKKINEHFGEKITVDKLVNKLINLDILKEHNVSLAASGALFDNTKEGILPTVMGLVLTSRKKTKSLMIQKQQERENETDELIKKKLDDEIIALDGQQMAFKILANAGYGAIANKHFRYYKLEIAEAITLSGQYCIQWIEKCVNNYLNDYCIKHGSIKKQKDRIIAIDTDSIMVNMEDFVDICFPKKENRPEIKSIVNVLDNFCKLKLNKFIDLSTKELSDYCNAKEHMVFFKREKIADVGLFIAKKRYILSVYNNEGVTYNAPKVKIIGIEAIKSSTPEICRKAIKECINIILSKREDKLLEYIDEFKIKFYNADIIDIATPKTANNISKFKGKSTLFIKGTPMQVRAAILYNDLIKTHKKQNEYELIKSNEKIKYVYLKIPNPIHENVIGFITKFPDFINLKSYIDYDTQFFKSFISPVQTMTNLLKWKIVDDGTKESLEAFFI